jgi:hypothetical protein
VGGPKLIASTTKKGEGREKGGGGGGSNLHIDRIWSLKNECTCHALRMDEIINSTTKYENSEP